jgi:acetylornithine deacetylase/succinyl-diaminopimelate desuccinylase-like protein
VGKGLVNNRAQVAAMMVAVRALHRVAAPDGGVLFLGTAQETGAPVETLADPARDTGPHSSEGHGARRAIAAGIRGRQALIGEPTGFAISRAQAGYLRVRVEVPGFIPYTPFIERGDDPLATPNSIERAAHVVNRIVRWAKQYERRERFDFPGGTMIPRAQVQDIRRPGILFTEADDPCDVYVDIRTAPGRDDRALLDDLERSLEDLAFQCTLTVYDRARGHVAAGSDRLTAAVETAHRRVFGELPGTPRPAQVSMWHDSNAFNEAGIPAVSYGVAPRPEPYTRERIRATTADDLVRLATVYALTAFDVGGADRPATAGHGESAEVPS